MVSRAVPVPWSFSKLVVDRSRFSSSMKTVCVGLAIFEAAKGDNQVG